MKLTDIRQLTSSNRILLLFEDGTKLRVWKQTVMDHGLFSGMEIDEAFYDTLRSAAAEDHAKDRAVRIVSSTNISKKQLAMRLMQKGESAEDSEKAIAWLESLNFLDDRRSGEMIVRSALNKGYGEHRIRQILREKQIPQELWEELLSDLPDMSSSVDKLLRQKIKNADDKKEIQRAVNTLMRHGHSWSDIKAGLDRLKVDMEEPECL